jgi:large subunit ribosomal protein L4
VSVTEAPVSSVRKRERPEPTKREVERRTAGGAVLGTVELDGEWFGHVPNVALMHQVVVAQLAAARSGTQSTKTRAEVAGGGAKPFRQKGMGRSRQGSIRAPHWVGGGVAFGPKPRSYRQRTPKKMIRQALRSALSDRAALGRVALVNDWGIEEIPKTKMAVAALSALGLSGRVLVVLGQDDVVAERSFGNLQRIQTLQVGELNTYDVLRNDWIVFTDESLPGGVGDISSHKRPEDVVVEPTVAPEQETAKSPRRRSSAKVAVETDTETDTDAETAAADNREADADDVDAESAEGDTDADAVTDSDTATDDETETDTDDETETDTDDESGESES